MAENDWICLTPDDQHDLTPLMYQRTPADRHWLEAGCSDMQLSNAEALAFARQLPKVKALVEECRWWLETGRFLAGNAPAKQAGVERTQAALAPFEEAPDA